MGVQQAAKGNRGLSAQACSIQAGTVRESLA
jgi:hypothetical protein